MRTCICCYYGKDLGYPDEKDCKLDEICAQCVLNTTYGVADLTAFEQTLKNGLKIGVECCVCGEKQQLGFELLMCDEHIMFVADEPQETKK